MPLKEGHDSKEEGVEWLLLISNWEFEYLSHLWNVSLKGRDTSLCTADPSPKGGGCPVRLEGLHEIAHQWHLFDQLSDSGSLEIVLHLLEKQKENLAYVNLTWGPTPHTPS